MNNLKKILFTFIILSTFSMKTIAAVGPYDTQKFLNANGWSDSSSSESVTHDNWQLVDGYINLNLAALSPFSIPVSPHPSDWIDCSVWLTTINSSFVTPQLTNGAGSISFQLNNAKSGQNDFSIQYSATGEAPWITVTNMQYNSEDWESRTAQINVYTSIYVRILKTGETGTGQMLGLDDIVIVRPMAYIEISEVQAFPLNPIISTEVDLTCHIESWGNVSATTVTSFWRVVDAAGEWNPITMEPNTPPASNNWITTSPIPSQAPADTLIEYWIHAEFSGYNAASPTNYPFDAPSNIVPLLYREPVYFSNYTNIYLTGDFDTNLVKTADYLWQGVVKLTEPATNSVFKYVGTNASGTTAWGDDEQTFTTMPVFGVTETNGPNIILNGSHTDYLFFSFDEATKDYSIQKCSYVDFDTWSGAETFGTYTNGEDWIISDCRMTTNSIEDQTRVLSGRSCIMNNDSGPQYIISPLMSNGIGEIAFSYRNWETNGAIAVDLDIQVSTNTAGPWTTISSINTIRNANYLHFSHFRSDRDNHYVRIFSGTNNNSKLCIDNLVITDPGPGVTFDTPTIDPPSPNILDTPTISVNATLWAHATDPQCTLWYRYNTNFPFAAIPMTNVGLIFTSSNSIPRMPVGDVHYYIECSIQGMSSTERTITYSPSSEQTPTFNYAVTNWSTIQTFAHADNWNDSGASESATYDNWQLVDSYVNLNLSTLSPFDMPKSRHPSDWLDCAVWLTTTNSALISEQYPNGVGTFSFYANNLYAGVNYFSIQYSGNDSGPWTNITDSSYGDEAWSDLTFEVNITSSIYIRILKTADSGGNSNGQLLGIDDVSISMPPAMVAITQSLTNPGYPASNDTVNVSCYIDSINPNFRAFNIGARLYYRTGGSGLFANSIPMNKASTNYFVTTEPIPIFPADTLVEYYIESTFDGYASSTEYKQSPTYLSAGVAHGTNTHYFTPPIANHLNYTTRYYKSEYKFLQLTGLESPLNMELLNDNLWQGIFTFNEAVTNPAIMLSGLFHYTGTNYADTADTWADIYQTRTQIPLYNLMLPGETNALTMAGVQQGQYVFRFDEVNMSYILHRCAFQDFDDWYADDEYFLESWSYDDNLIVVTNNFDDWPLTSYPQWPIEKFQNGWTNSTSYQGDELQGATGWIIHQCLIISQLDNDYACQMKDDFSANPYLRPIPGRETEGIDSFNFDYRCVDTNFYPAIHWNATNWANSFVSATIKATDLPVNDNGYSFGNCGVSLISHYFNKNYYYELRLQQTDLNTYNINLYRKSGSSNATLLATSPDTYPGDISTERTLSLFTSVAGSGKVAFEVYDSGAYLYHYYDVIGLTSTSNAVGVNTIDANIEVDNFRSGCGHIQHFDNWLPGGPYTSPITNMSWVADEATINGKAPAATIGNVIELSSSGYIRSPLLPHGVGSIRTIHHGEDANSQYKFHVQYSTTGSSNDGDWTTISTIERPSSPDNNTWITYSQQTNIAINNIYIRIKMDTASANDGWFDQISIQPSFDTGMGSYEETFDDDVADELSDPSGWWNIKTNAANNLVYTRPGYTSDPLSFNLQTAIKADWESLSANYVWKTRYSITNNQTHYISVSFPIEESGGMPSTATAYARLQHSGGDGHLVFDNVEFQSWHGKQTIHTNNWSASEAWVTKDGAMTATGTCVELSYSRAYTNNYTNKLQYIRSDQLMNGVGVVKFYSKNMNSTPAVFELQYSDDLAHSWDTLRTITNDTMDWKSHVVSLDSSAPTYIQILHISTNQNARLLIDNIEVSGFSARDEYNWVAYNSLVTSLLTNKLWETDRHAEELTAYLNYGPGVYPDTPNTLNQYVSHIQSPRKTRGIGEISFWYRSWNTDPTNPPTLLIKAATEYAIAESNWVEIAAITNFSNTEYKYFTMPYYDLTNHFVRFYADLGVSEDSRICIDDILVMDPLGADMIIQNLRIIPEIPLTDEPVQVQIDLAQYLLDVNITSLQLRYLTGTNTWATWAPGNVINMSQVTNNPSAGTYTWQTDTPIPGQGVDTPVQYYIYSEFAGTFADKGGSPKTYREFSNPTHYSPINLNTYFGTNIPYYIVFSCLPGSVWVNEVNIIDSLGWLEPNYSNEFIELCSLNATDISNWSIELLNENAAKVAMYNIPASSSISTTANGYGYWTLGDIGVNNINMTLTNIISGGGADQSFPDPVGAIILRRSMGAIEYKLFYNNTDSTIPPIFSSFEYIGTDIWEDWVDFGGITGSLQLEGISSNYASFAWSFTNVTTAGEINLNQDFEQQPPEIAIIDFQMLSTAIKIFYTQSGGAPSIPFYKTNLMQQATWLVSDYTGPTESNGIYTITIALPTNAPTYFYKLTTTP